MKQSIILFIICVSLLGCATNQAKARAIDANTNRVNDWHSLRLDEAQANSAHRVATNRIYLWYGLGLTILFGLSTLTAYTYWTIGKAKADVAKAHLIAKLIPLDPQTMQYPLLQTEVKGRLFLINPNDKSVIRIGKPANADRQALHGSQIVQLAAVSGSRDFVITHPQLEDGNL